MFRKEVDYEIIPVEEVPERIGRRKGWSKILQKFVDSDHNIAYIQLETKRQMQLAASAFHAVKNNDWANGTKVYQYGDLLRVYLEKPLHKQRNVKGDKK